MGEDGEAGRYNARVAAFKAPSAYENTRHGKNKFFSRDRYGDRF